MTEANNELAAIFRTMANLLGRQGANAHRIRAYRRAADSLARLGEPVQDIAARGTLEEIAGIGKELAAKIREFLSTGQVQSYEALKTPLPEDVANWATLPGLSPAIVQDLYYRLGVQTLPDLETLVRTHLLQTLPGITASDDEMLAAIRERLDREER